MSPGEEHEVELGKDVSVRYIKVVFEGGDVNIAVELAI